MRVCIEVATHGNERRASVTIAPDELARVHLHLELPERRNRTGRYMRRHGHAVSESGRALERFGPNDPRRSPDEPPKLTIPDHVSDMRRTGQLPTPAPNQSSGSEVFRCEPHMLAVPISDLVANLLRPCFSRQGFGKHRVFYFDAEPIEERP